MAKPLPVGHAPPYCGRMAARLAAAVMLLLATGIALQGPAAAQNATPPLESARQALWEQREAGTLTQPEYLQRARQLEAQLRTNVLQPIMDELGIKHTGNPPTVGGGIFSDVDGTAATEAQYQAFLQRIKQLDPNVEVYDRYSFRSPRFDLVGWRPGGSVPRGHGIGADYERHIGQSLNNELAPTAIPGAGRPSALEANLEDLSKGAGQMFDPLKPGYAGEADMVAAGKDVMRSMRAAGMCDKQPLTCRWLTDLRSRTRSPRELGFANLAQLQQRLVELAGEAYRESEAQFAREHTELIEQLQRAGTGPERDRLVKLADQMAERSARMAARYEALHHQHPRIQAITGARGPRLFWAEHNERIKVLRQAQQQAHRNVTGTRGLTVLLNLAEFARCMSAETTARVEARRAQARACLARAAFDYVAGRGLEHALGKTINFITVTLPNGAAVASVLPAAMAGIAAIEAGLQVIDMSFELWLLNDAWLEEQRNQQTLEQSMIRNVAEFPRRLAAAEAVVAQAQRDIDARSRALLADLQRLVAEQARLIERAQLRDRRARLDALLPGIKARSEACWQAVGEASGGPPDTAALMDDALGQARAAVANCADRGALRRADALFQGANQRLNTLRQELLRPPAPAAGARAAQADDAARQLDEARRHAAALEEVAAAARDNARDLERFRDRMRALDESIELERARLALTVETLQQAVPLALVQALQQHTPRLRTLRQRIDAIAPPPASAWEPRWNNARAADAPLRAVIETMQEIGPALARTLGDADDCQQRRAGIDTRQALLERAEGVWGSSGAKVRALLDACRTRLDQGDLLARLRARVAQEQAALTQRHDGARHAREQAALQHDAAQRQVQGLLAAREGAPRGTAATGPANGLAAELAGADALCRHAQQARGKLGDTLRQLDADGQTIEDRLREGERLGARCVDRAMLDAARDQLAEAAALQTRVDQRAAALALLAVQVDDLVAQRRRLLELRGKAQALLAQAPPAAVRSAAATPIDFNPLDAALLAMRQQGPDWARQQTERARAALATLRAEFTALDAATLDAALQPLALKGRALAALAWTDAELQQRAALGVALRQRADAAARHTGPAVDWRALHAAYQDAACLDQSFPNLRAGLDQADTLRSVAQLATQKLGAPARTALNACAARLDRRLSEPQKLAQVAAKVCRYPGSEPIWDEREYRPMCRCQAGRRWNADRSACVVEPRSTPPAPPAPAGGSVHGVRAGWIGSWTCRFEGGARSLNLRRTMPERLQMVIRDDGRGHLLVSDGKPPWDPLPLTDDTHFQLPPMAAGATPMVFELRGPTIVGQMRIKVEGVQAYVSAQCAR